MVRAAPAVPFCDTRRGCGGAAQRFRRTEFDDDVAIRDTRDGSNWVSVEAIEASTATAEVSRPGRHRMTLFEGKVALITGAARGQGRAHAVRLAAEGADIVGVDICAQPEHVEIPGATLEDLRETEALVSRAGRRFVSHVGDVADFGFLRAVVEQTIGDFGRLDIVCASAGVWAISADPGPVSDDQRHGAWQATISANLTGAWNTLDAVTPAMVKAGNGGSVTLVGSVASLSGQWPMDALGTRVHAAQMGYVASKHALVGLMRSYALALAEHSIRVNCLIPTGVKTVMSQNEIVNAIGERHPSAFDVFANKMPLDVLEPADVSDALVYLASEAGRFTTGITLPIDGGFLLR